MSLPHEVNWSCLSSQKTAWHSCVLIEHEEMSIPINTLKLNTNKNTKILQISLSSGISRRWLCSERKPSLTCCNLLSSFLRNSTIVGCFMGINLERHPNDKHKQTRHGGVVVLLRHFRYPVEVLSWYRGFLEQPSTDAEFTCVGCCNPDTSNSQLD